MGWNDHVCYGCQKAECICPPTEEDLQEELRAQEEAEEERLEQEAIDNAEEEEGIAQAEQAEEDRQIEEAEKIHDIYFSFRSAVKAFNNMSSEASEEIFTSDNIAEHLYAIRDYYRELQKRYPKIAEIYETRTSR